MKKILLIFVLVLSVLAICAQTVTCRVDAPANIREKPNKKSAIVGRINNSITVTASHAKGKMWRIENISSNSGRNNYTGKVVGYYTHRQNLIFDEGSTNDSLTIASQDTINSKDLIGSLGYYTKSFFAKQKQTGGFLFYAVCVLAIILLVNSIMCIYCKKSFNDDPIKYLIAGSACGFVLTGIFAYFSFMSQSVWIGVFDIIIMIAYSPIIKFICNEINLSYYDESELSKILGVSRVCELALAGIIVYFSCKSHSIWIWAAVIIVMIVYFPLIRFVDNLICNKKCDLINQRMQQEQIRQEQIRQEQIRQEQIRQEQIRQEQIRQENSNRAKCYVSENLEKFPILKPYSVALVKFMNAYYNQESGLIGQNQYSLIKQDCSNEIQKAIYDDINRIPMLGLFINAANDSKLSPLEFINKVSALSNENYVFSSIPMGTSYHILFSGELDISFPNEISLLESNYGIAYPLNNESSVANYFESLLFSLILSMPVGCVKLRIVDLEFKYLLNSLINNLPDEICSQTPISDERSLKLLLDELDEHFHTVVSQYDDIQEYNRKNNTIEIPYTIIVLTNIGYNYDRNTIARLNRLIKQGHRAGIYFMGLLPDTESATIDGMMLHKYIICDYKNLIYNVKELKEASFKYLSESIKAIKEKELELAKKIEEQANRSISLDYKQYLDKQYISTSNGIRVEVGQTANGEKAYFELDTIQNAHAFIIGSTGSGKSVFLHDIISGIELTYAPEDVQLYLLDMKIGGVEFVRYKKTPHRKVLLVDNSDIYITLEIFRELKKEMLCRGKEFKMHNVQNIDDYNKRNTSTRLPHLVFVVDECQKIFQKEFDIPRSVWDEMQSILKIIVKEGRSQGVHLILATQTLVGTEINGEILNNINVKCILKSSMTDAQKLVSNINEEVVRLQTCMVMQYSAGQYNTFRSYYNKDVEGLMNAICKKASGHNNANKFYFSGTMSFSLFDANLSSISIRASNEMLIGKKLDLDLEDIKISLKNRASENVLVVGINEEGQSMRTSFNIFLSSVIKNRETGEIKHYVLNFLEDDNNHYNTLIDTLASKGLCEIIDRKNMGKFLAKTASEIKNETFCNSIIYIIGQDRFKELDKNDKLEKKEQSKITHTSKSLFPMTSNVSTALDNAYCVSTYKEAMGVIIGDGPDNGVHTIMQLEKMQNFMFEGSASRRSVLSKFSHVIMLRSDSRAGSMVADDLKPELLSAESERLRAYYYNDNTTKFCLLTPYADIEKQQLNKF